MKGKQCSHWDPIEVLYCIVDERAAPCGAIEYKVRWLPTVMSSKEIKTWKAAGYEVVQATPSGTLLNSSR